jgi:hypothetical protein
LSTLDVHTSALNGIATSGVPEFYDPEENPPPKGVDLLIFQRGGVLIKSQWLDGCGFLAWYPLPKTPKWLKHLSYSSYIASGLKETNETDLVAGND